MGSNYRAIPSVDKLLSCPEIKQVSSGISHEYLLDIVRECLADIRKRIASGESPLEAESIAEMVLNRVNLMFQPTLVPVINATGVILHTNLGRAPLSTEAVKAMSEVAGSYSSLEVDLSSGRRGSRQEHVENILCRLTGAEAAMAVNNNAGAVMLALSALARKKEVIVSRGQAVEIGGRRGGIGNAEDQVIEQPAGAPHQVLVPARERIKRPRIHRFDHVRPIAIVGSSLVPPSPASARPTVAARPTAPPTRHTRAPEAAGAAAVPRESPATHSA